MTNNGLALMLGIGLVTFIGSVWSAERRKQCEARVKAARVPHREVSRWEGEGGNVLDIPTARPVPA
ncbi:hypothetical protein FNU76_14945 [Chitinimonas arctica]|uniref:Uncharacterized protein n=1 Tax=Chitinimonas arctica TaxID=2594795 RepID=A0A516SHA8_9NEIS|nr:hypothetical protein [Chitinimonas arctica]QDQ27546.1 hypothetical protein FNU76_14945 [Chitinimonas arctica]